MSTQQHLPPVNQLARDLYAQHVGESKESAPSATSAASSPGLQT